MGTFSVEEIDHLERSVKEIKVSIEGDKGEETQPVTIRSFKDTLVGGKKNANHVAMLDNINKVAANHVAMLGNIDKVAFDVEANWSDDELMIDEVVDNSIPSITIDKDVKKN
ncbi:hypothetical protein REPUB_Repub20aG0124300 [Reevesia pubescens]